MDIKTEDTFVDEAGAIWIRPTAEMYAKVCKNLHKFYEVMTEARDHLYTKQDCDRIREMAKELLDSRSIDD